MNPDHSSSAPYCHENARLSTTSSLIGGLKEMSPERWRCFLLVYSPLLRFWIHCKAASPQAEDDILQECLQSIFTGINQFEKDSTKGTFRGWLRIIVQRRVADHFRSQSRERPVPQAVLYSISAPEQKDPAELLAEEHALQDLKARAMELTRRSTSERSWQMFWLTTVEKMTTAEVASQFQVSAAAVRVAKARVTQRLKDLLMEG
jgi:RNA polymerase sigma factor (sigma-70 family)